MDARMKKCVKGVNEEWMNKGWRRKNWMKEGNESWMNRLTGRGKMKGG